MGLAPGSLSGGGGGANSAKKALPLVVCVLVLPRVRSSSAGLAARLTTIRPEKTLSYLERAASATRKTETGLGAGRAAAAAAAAAAATRGSGGEGGGGRFSESAGWCGGGLGEEWELGRARLRMGEMCEGAVDEVEGRLARGITEPVFFQRTPQALHRVLGPAGPARHRGVSVVWQWTQRRARGRRATEEGRRVEEEGADAKGGERDSGAGAAGFMAGMTGAGEKGDADGGLGRERGWRWLGEH